MPDDKYEDTGCHLAPSCLRCPFPVCYLDELTEKKHIKPEDVQRTIHLPPRKAALELGLSVWAVGYWRRKWRGDDLL